MARRSARLAQPSGLPKTAAQETAKRTVTPIRPAPMNWPIVPRPPLLPIKPGVVTFLDLPGEIRNQVYSELLPDVKIADACRYKKLRRDKQKTSSTFMATCHQVYEEPVSILYPATVADAVQLRFDSAGTTAFLGRVKKLIWIKPSDLSVLSRVKRINLQIEIGKSFDPPAVCDVQDALFNMTRLLADGHQLEGISVNIDIGPDPEPYRMSNDPSSNDWDLLDMLNMHVFGFGLRGYGGNIGRMQEFRNVKPGDISRAHIAAFLTDGLRMIRKVKNGPKYRVFSLSFPGKTGRPWRELDGQVYNLIRGDTAVPNFTTFTRYFDALRQLKRVFYCFGKEVRDDDHCGNKRAYEKFATQLGAARIRADVSRFREVHANLLDVIDSSIAMRIDFNRSNSYSVAEKKEQWCRELTYLKIELEDALPDGNLDVSFRGYNIADAGLFEWQTVGREEAREAKRKRKADQQALKESIAKKAKDEGTSDAKDAMAELGGESD